MDTLVKRFSGTLFFAILAILLSSQIQEVRAQDAGPPPVARLVSTTSNVSPDRPRRVNTPTASASVSEEKTSSFAEANWVEQRAFIQTNEERSRHGLPPLQWDPDLCRMARLHSERMAKLGFFSHKTPEGQHLRDRARSNGIRFKVIAENIAYNHGFEDPGAFAVERWMLSAGHRANILYSGFESSAVGVFIAEDGSVYLTQAFIMR